MRPDAFKKESPQKSESGDVAGLRRLSRWRRRPLF